MRTLGILLPVVIIVACGGDQANTTPDDGGGKDTSLDTSQSESSTKDAPSDAPVDAGPDVVPLACDGGVCPPVFAFRKIFLGDTDRQFVQANSAWKPYGDNIDGKVTTGQSTDVCQRVQGAPSSAQIDGNNGIDNSFGSNIIPVLQSVSGQNISKQASAAIEGGQGTLLVRIAGLGTAPDYSVLSGSMYKGMPFGGQPLWNGSDLRSVSSQSVTANDVNQPLIVFAKGLMAARAYDSAQAPGVSVLTLGAGNIALSLPIRLLRIHADVAADNSGASTGIVSGVMKTTEFVDAFHQVAGALSASLCSGSAWDSIAAQLAQASDILQDGTQDPTKTCDAISIGIGFEATAVSLGTVQNDPVGPKPCP